jgi:hypothetical protein
MWQDNKDNFVNGEIVSSQAQGISLSGGSEVDGFLPTTPLGCLLLPPDGLGVPSVRSGDVAFAQRDGVEQFGDYYEPRQLTFQVIVKNDACPGCLPTPQVDGALVLNGVAPGHAFTPNSAPLQITGDIDIRVYLAMDDWTPDMFQSPVTKWGDVGDRSYLIQINPAGEIRLVWSDDGTAVIAVASTVALSIADGEPLWIRATLDVDNGGGSREVTFYTSTDGMTWTQLGAMVPGAVTSIFAGPAQVEIGGHSDGTADLVTGRVFSAEIRTGINGTIVANPNFDQPGGTTPFVDGSGNTWSVVPPAFLQPFVAATMSARQKVKRLTTEWSRSCTQAILVLFTDCHQADATEEEKTYLGPYLVRGRPRVAQVEWMRSNRGAARVTLRFDAQDARLQLADTGAGNWHATHTQSMSAGAAAGGNIAQDYRLTDVTFDTQDAVATQSTISSGAPDGGSYLSINVTTPNTTSPMSGAAAGSGTDGIPVTAGNDYAFAWWARQIPDGTISTRVDAVWRDAGGVLLSTSTGVNQDATEDWTRFTQTFAAPAMAAFMQPVLRWSGIALANQTLDLAQLWINEGATAGEPATIEVVGDLCVFPVFRLDGPLTAPITVSYGPFSFTYDEDVGALERVTVDTRWGRASSGISDETQHLLGDYTFPLSPGVHEVSFTTGDPADTGSVQIEWENAVISG